MDRRKFDRALDLFSVCFIVGEIFVLILLTGFFMDNRSSVVIFSLFPDTVVVDFFVEDISLLVILLRGDFAGVP